MVSSLENGGLKNRVLIQNTNIMQFIYNFNVIFHASLKNSLQPLVKVLNYWPYHSAIPWCLIKEHFFDCLIEQWFSKFFLDIWNPLSLLGEGGKQCNCYECTAAGQAGDILFTMGSLEGLGSLWATLQHSPRHQNIQKGRIPNFPVWHPWSGKWRKDIDPYIIILVWSDSSFS